MEPNKMLKNVCNLNDYISVTQDLLNSSYNKTKFQFNMSSVLVLKKVRSLEIEYFNKCEGNGAALLLFERMVDQPPSKTWSLLGKELVDLLQYWLDAMRKHLIKHSYHWWTFLKSLLKFIKNMRVKDKNLPDILVNGTAECLLDLATSAEPDTAQRHEILYCLNLCCAESSREIRFALRISLESYFTKLATLIASCGHLPTQYSILEALLRWLLPRHDVSVRQDAAAKWFPAAVCGKTALNLFLERPWQNFFQDARDFLNAFNASRNLVTSFLCRIIAIGSVSVISGTEKRETWLDLNSWDSSASVVLDPRLLDALCVPDAPTWETLRVLAGDVHSAQLTRETSEVTLTIRTVQPPRLLPSEVTISEACELRVVVSSTADLRQMDRALRDIFGQKYQVLLDLDKPTSLSPQERTENKKCYPGMEEDTRFSHPIEVHKRKRSGFMVRSKNPILWKSPSTASTTSLAQLHEKLASLPQYKFDKEAVHVCALPELSTVTEVSETDDRTSLHTASTIRINRPFGVCHKNNKTSDRNSQSDGEVQNKTIAGRYLSPAAKDEDHSTSCLLVATIGSAEESIINDTLERLTRNKDFQSNNIVDLLVQEAMQRDYSTRDLSDSGINSEDNRKTLEQIETHSEAIGNTPIEDLNSNGVKNKPECEKSCTVISNTTTDESNDVVYDTPLNFVNVKKRNLKNKVVKERATKKPNEGQIFDVKEVEDFFSRHISENNRGEIVISPTLARKINETSSESEQFEDCFTAHEDNNVNVEQIDVYDINIIECLNNIVDKVCSDFDKFTKILDRDPTPVELLEIAVNNNTDDVEKNEQQPLKDVSNIIKPTEDPIERIESKKSDTPTIKPNKTIKLKFNTKRTAKSRANAKQKRNKLELEPAPRMSPIKEANEAVGNDNTIKTPETGKKSSSNESTDLDVALIKRKRKLYSPKYESNTERVLKVTEIDDEKYFKTSKITTPKYKATSYKDIEMDRQKRLRKPRTRKSRYKSESSPSPRTKKNNDIFNQLKEKVECPDPVMVVDKKALDKDMAVYNFTSDSEDEDFKRKKIEVQKRISSTTIASGDSIMSTKHGRSVNRINYSETKSSDESYKNNVLKPKRTVRRKKAQPKSRLQKPVPPLIDEKLRDAVVEELNTSLVINNAPKHKSEEPILTLPEKPQMETIPDETITEVKETNEKAKKTTRRNKKTDALSLKRDKKDKLHIIKYERDNDDRTTSPLPGLIVETMPVPRDDANDSVSANMLQKFKKIYQDGPEKYINESNTTQNLLSDVERVNYSPIPLNLTDEFDKAGNYSKISDVSNEITEVPTPSSNKKTNIKEAVIDLSENYGSKIDSAEILRIKNGKSVEMKNSKNQTPEVINLIQISDDKSEVSIATVGKSPITAHGDSDEHPPGSELLTENIRPRDLDIEYMDKSMKDYFDRLRTELNEIPSNSARKDSIDSDSTRLLNNDDRLTNKSPVVSIARMSLDDISKWLPSRRNSDTDSSYSKENSKQIQYKNAKETSEPATNPKSDKNISPVLKIDKIFLEFDFENDESKKTHSTKSKPTSKHKKLNTEDMTCVLYNNDSDTGNNEEVKATEKSKGKKSKINNKFDDNINAESKWLRSRGRIDTKQSTCNSISPIREGKNATPKKTKTVLTSQENRKSLISPIKLFDDLKFTSKTMSTNKKLNRAASQLQDELKLNTDKPSYAYQAKNIEVSSPGSRKSSSNEAVVSRLKRKSKSPVIGNIKRRKVEDTVVSISESGPSVSSVNDWFRRNTPVCRGEDISATFRESIENVVEKLDTTLAEIHENTSKKFIHMFVDAQKQLSAVRQQRRAALRACAADVLAHVARVIDDKFADLDRRSQEMDAQFMEKLKVQASALIREDCQKKQVMVSLLREDLNVTLAQIDKKRRGETL